MLNSCDAADNAIRLVKNARPRLELAKRVFDDELSDESKSQLRPLANYVVRVHNATLKELRTRQQQQKLAGGMVNKIGSFVKKVAAKVMPGPEAAPMTLEESALLNKARQTKSGPLAQRVIRSAEDAIRTRAMLQQTAAGKARKIPANLQRLDAQANALIQELRGLQNQAGSSLSDQTVWKHSVLRLLTTTLRNISAAIQEFDNAAAAHLGPLARNGVDNCGQVFGCETDTVDDKCRDATLAKWKKHPPSETARAQANEWLTDCWALGRATGSAASSDGQRALSDLKLLLQKQPAGKQHHDNTKTMTLAQIRSFNNNHLYSFEQGLQK